MPNYYIGVDVGATKIAAGLVVDGKIAHHVTIATPTTNGRAVISAIAKTLGVFAHPRVRGVGVGIAGAVDAARGIVYSSPNLPRDFHNVALPKLLRRIAHVPVAVENDAKCFVLAEATAGAGKGKRTVVGFTLGSGVGGGVVIDGNLLSGRDGLAGHLGHTTVVEHGLSCSCGQRGHIESYASGGGLARFYRQLTGETIDPYELERRVLNREPAARKTFAYAAEILATAIANAITTFNPEVVVLGGGLTRVPTFWRPAVRLTKKLVPYRELLPVPIVRAKLGQRAGVIGAALVASRDVK